APLVAVAGRSDDADPGAADVERRAGADFARPVGRDVAVALEQCRIGIGQTRGEVLALPRGRIVEIAGDCGIAQRRGEIARAVVETEPVEIAAIIGVAKIERRLGITADAATDIEESVARHGWRGEIDDAAAELAMTLVGKMSSGTTRRSGSGLGRGEPLSRAEE